MGARNEPLRRSRDSRRSLLLPHRLDVARLAAIARSAVDDTGGCAGVDEGRAPGELEEVAAGVGVRGEVGATWMTSIEQMKQELRENGWVRSGHLCWKSPNGAAYRGPSRAWQVMKMQAESPEQILARLAERLGCEPRQVGDRVIRMLEERG